jgi:hypothetical protein
LLISLACDAYNSPSPVHVVEIQPDQLRHPDTGAVEQFEHHPVAELFRFVTVESFNDLSGLVSRQHRRDRAVRSRTDQELTDVGGQ